MAIYRNVHLTFWDDTKIVDDFTPEDKYFYLYLLTNPHTNLCGCYEISLKQMARETGYNEDTIKRLIERMENVHGVLKYENSTKEILIWNWHKYNWSKSKDLITGVISASNNIKSNEFKNIIMQIVDCVINGNTFDKNRLSMHGPETTDTDALSVSAPDTDHDFKNSPPKESYKEMFERLLQGYNISDHLLESVNDWIAYKRERRFSYKESGLKTLLSQIEKNSRKYGDEAVSTAISESIASGYQGIVFDKIGRYVNYNQRNNNNNFGHGSINWDNV